MKRRDFLFTSLKAAALLSPALSLRSAFAQGAPPRRVFFWVNCCGYPSADAFFPTGGERDFQLSPILSSLEPLRNDLVIVDGIDIRPTGLNPRGAEHLRSMGKVLTAKDINESRSDPENEGEAGGISIDQLLAQGLGKTSIELNVADRLRDSMRNQPFATGPNQFKTPIVDPGQAWNQLFGGFTPPAGEDPAVRAQRLKRLSLRKSLLDDLRGDLSRLRAELSGVERLKLDIHEDSIRKAERAVQADLDARPPAQCTVPGDSYGSSMPERCAAHLELVYSAFACDRAQVAGLVWGSSGYHWLYNWAGVQVEGSIHDEVHHLPGARRDDYIRAAQWDWQQLGAFVQRLKNTPEGSGTMLDNTLVVAISHFGVHHEIHRIPVVLFGNANGRLSTGRFVKLSGTEFNDKLLTSVAHLMGMPIAGFGDDPQCGPLTQL
ncbi:MAG: DUF1552 domain-containing protein [Myxococcota bacterium]